MRPWRHAVGLRAAASACAVLALVLALAQSCLIAAPAWAADDQGGATQGDAQGEDASGVADKASSEESSPHPLDAQDNAINEGQVSDSSFLYDAAIADLVGADSYYDGQTVQITGEAVGEAIRSLGGSGEEGGEVHVTLYEASSGSSVTVSMSASDAEKIGMYGAYGRTGDTLRVQGTFHLVCKTHEGESDVHAEAVSVVQAGSEHPDELHPKKFIPGAVAVVAGLILMFVFWRIKERSR